MGDRLPTFMVAATLVPKTKWCHLPLPASWSLKALDKVGVLPASAERIIEDTLYLSIKRQGKCWVVPLEVLGLVSSEVTYRAVKQTFLEFIKKYPDQRVLVKGQSQGGRYAIELALDKETRNYIAAVQVDGWAYGGTDFLLNWWMKWAWVFPGVQEMVPGDPTLVNLQMRMRNGWLKRIPLAVVVSVDDEFVLPWQRAAAVKLRKDCDVRVFVLSRSCPRDLPRDAVWIPVKRPVRHVPMEWAGEVGVLTQCLHDECIRTTLKHLPPSRQDFSSKSMRRHAA